MGLESSGLVPSESLDGALLPVSREMSDLLSGEDSPRMVSYIENRNSFGKSSSQSKISRLALNGVRPHRNEDANGNIVVDSPSPKDTKRSAVRSDIHDQSRSSTQEGRVFSTKKPEIDRTKSSISVSSSDLVSKLTSRSKTNIFSVKSEVQINQNSSGKQCKPSVDSDVPRAENLRTSLLMLPKSAQVSVKQRKVHQMSANQRSTSKKFNDPRYRIPATRGRSKLTLTVPTSGSRDLPKRQSSAAVAEPLSITMQDLASAAAPLPEYKLPSKNMNNDWMFSTEDDVRKFRSLLQDSPRLVAGRGADIRGDAGVYLDRDKVRWISEWIQNVEQAQGREGKFTDTISDVSVMAARERRRRVTGYVVRSQNSAINPAHWRVNQRDNNAS